MKFPTERLPLSYLPIKDRLAPMNARQPKAALLSVIRAPPSFGLRPVVAKLSFGLLERGGIAVRHARRGRHDRGDGPDPSHVWRPEARAFRKRCCQAAALSAADT